MTSSVIHIATYNIITLIFRTEWYYSLYIHHIFFIDIYGDFELWTL